MIFGRDSYWPAHPLTAFGLILGLIGVGIIFIWGPPQPAFQEYVAISVEPATPMSDGRTAQEHADEAVKKRKLFAHMSQFGLALIFIGFGLQLLDAWK